jgi:hypothetical protein
VYVVFDADLVSIEIHRMDYPVSPQSAASGRFDVWQYAFPSEYFEVLSSPKLATFPVKVQPSSEWCKPGDLVRVPEHLCPFQVFRLQGKQWELLNVK